MSDDKSKKKSGWMGMNDAVNNALGITDDEPTVDEPMFKEGEDFLLDEEPSTENYGDEDIFNQMPAARSGEERKSAAKAKPVAKKPIQPANPFPAEATSLDDDIFNQRPAAPPTPTANTKPTPQDNASAALGIPTQKQTDNAAELAKQAKIKAEQQQIEEEKRLLLEEEQKLKAKQRALEEKQIQQELKAKQAEQARLAEAKRAAEQAKQAEAKRAAEQAKRAEAKRAAELAKQAEAKRTADQAKQAEAKRAADLAKQAEVKRAKAKQAAKQAKSASKTTSSQNLELKPLNESVVVKDRTWLRPIIKYSTILFVLIGISTGLYVFKDPIIKKIETTWKNFTKPDKVVKKAKPKTKKVSKKKNTQSVATASTETITQVVVDSSKIPAWIDYFQDELKSGDKGPAMVKIFANQYFMGGKIETELPRHMVELQEFAVSLHEVTFEDYDKFASSTGRAKPKDEGWGRNKRPVINVSWFDAKAYAEWLSQQSGKTYRLPTEAEWEYLASTGKAAIYPWGNQLGSNNANCDTCNSQWEGKTAPVGSFKPNRFGVFDTSGNVAEWTEDCYHSTYIGAPEDGTAWTTDGDCSMYMIRGGSHNSDESDIANTARNYTAPSSKTSYIGFRLVREY